MASKYIQVAHGEISNEEGSWELDYYVKEIEIEGRISYGIKIEQRPTVESWEEETWNAWTASYEEAEKWVLMMANAGVTPSMLQELFIDFVA